MNNRELQDKITQIAYLLLFEKGFVCTVDILLKLGYLKQNDYEAWRFGKIRYLERVCIIGLGKLSTIQQMIKKVATDLNLEKSWTAYNRYGKGEKERLIFSKSGNKIIEDSYATHYIDKKRINELKMQKVNAI